MNVEMDLDMDFFGHRALSEGGVLSGHAPLDDFTSKFFVQVVIIVGLCRGLAIIGQKLRQPAVIFEIIGGILLGPTLISRNAYFRDVIFSKSSRSYLVLFSNVGLVLYLFVVGMELDPVLLISHGHKAAGIAIAGMVVPFGLGVAISRTLFDTLQPEVDNEKFVGFYVFIGTAMSITAFPVLARILKEEGLIYTKSGAMVMGAAAINDAVAWCLLILAIALASAGNIAVGGYVFLCVVCFALGLFYIIRPPFHWLVREVESWNQPVWNRNLFALTLCMVFLCAFTTALLGVHAIFGGFLFGLIVPKNTKLFHDCNHNVEEIVVTLMLPVYFCISGLNTDITTIRTKDQGCMVLLVCFIATIGKFIGAGCASLAAGIPYRDSSVIMVLMNTRGLVELIVLNLGVQYGLLTTETFSVMVLMCLFTTFLTCPLVNLIYPKDMRRMTSAVDDESVHDAELSNKGIGLHLNQAYTSLKKLSIGIVVDELKEMELDMKLIYLFSHVLSDSLTAITAVKLNVSGSNTGKDCFIGLTEGRLIKVEEESTGIGTHEADSLAPAMLPLSMFAKAIGCSVNAFQVQGDPNDYPSQLRSMANFYENNLVLFPWKSSEYKDTLFWQTRLRLPVPIALVVSRGQSKQTVDEPRQRSGSISLSLKAISAAFSGGTPGDLVDTHEGGGEIDIEMAPSPRMHRAYSLTETFRNGLESFNFRKQDDFMNSSNFKNVLILLSDQSCDFFLLSLAARMVERKDVHVVVLIASHRQSFSEVSFH